MRSQARLAADEDKMRAVTARFRARGLDTVHIRFPNDELPLGGCDAGRIIYVFADGATALCPYLVFAARTPASRYAEGEFLVGNVLTGEIAQALDGYDFHARYRVGDNPTCGSCARSGACGKGCPAALVARGEFIGAVDVQQCPMPGARIRLPLVGVGASP